MLTRGPEIGVGPLGMAAWGLNGSTSGFPTNPNILGPNSWSFSVNSLKRFNVRSTSIRGVQWLDR